MATDYRSVNTLCPFYISEDGRRISCEGVQDNSHIRLLFDRSEAKKLYKLTYCESCYKSCRVCRMLLEKYE